MGWEFADYLDRYRRVHSAIAQSSPNFGAMAKELADVTQSIPPGSLLLDKALSSSISYQYTELYKMHAKILCAQVGMALERYRAAKGDYPAALGTLAPEFLPSVPVDVFNGQPLHYRRVPGGAVVYSVGPNLKDDGGVEDRESNKDDPAWHAGKALEAKP